MYYYAWHTLALAVLKHAVTAPGRKPWMYPTPSTNPQHYSIKITATQSELLKELFLENN